MKASEDERRIRVLSLNCWDMKWGFSKHRDIRMRALGEELSTANYDVICFQELWVHDDYVYMQTKTRHYLPYSHFFHAGFLGSGLAIFSRWPIIATSMFPFTLCGRPAAFWRGDYYAGKGIATVLIQHYTGLMIEVFNTHFHAPYGKGEDTYMCHRIAEAWEFAKMLRGAVERGRFVIGTGDFNCYPESIIHEIIVQHGLVADSWAVAHPDPVPNPLQLSEQEQIDLLGVTCDSRLNTFRPTNLDTSTDDGNAKRLDYIFTSETIVESSQVVLTDRIASHDINYSDHFGIAATMQIPEEYRKATGYLGPQIFNSIRDIYIPYVVREEKHKVLRCSHFYLSLAVCISMLTGVWFVEQKGSIFVMMFFSTMCSWCGVLDGVIGSVWGRSELRALKEFSSEIELARRVYAEEGIPVGSS